MTASFEKTSPIIFSDNYFRPITYLRVSVTDRCDFRCTYCMVENPCFLPKSQILSLEDIEKICTTFIKHGTKKIRITGGEPLVRKNIMNLFYGLGQYIKSGYLSELTLTTNASQLDKYAVELKEAGVNRINISLDTLNPEKFKSVTRIGHLEKILQNIQIAKQAGLKIKINTVAIKDFNEGEIDTLISWCGKNEFDLSLIEIMPLGSIDIEDDSHLRYDQYLSLQDIKERLSLNWTLEKTSFTTNGPSRYYTIKETGQKIGFITPLSQHFCESCNRVRLTCTGKLYTCLGHDHYEDLSPYIHNKSGLLKQIQKALDKKPKAHNFLIDQKNNTPAVNRFMNTTGG